MLTRVWRFSNFQDFTIRRFMINKWRPKSHWTIIWNKTYLLPIRLKWCSQSIASYLMECVSKCYQNVDHVISLNTFTQCDLVLRPSGSRRCYVFVKMVNSFIFPFFCRYGYMACMCCAVSLMKINFTAMRVRTCENMKSQNSSGGAVTQWNTRLNHFNYNIY